MTGRVLLVDDDPNLIAGLSRQFRGRYDLRTAKSGHEALSLIEKGEPFAVAMVDMRMPGMDGLTLLTELHERAPQTIRMMLTGNADLKTAIDAINRGRIFRFFSKPCDAQELMEGIEAGLHQYALEAAERVLLEKTLAGSVKVLVDVLSLVDPLSFGRAVRVRDWCRPLIAGAPGVSPWELELAALLCPIGAVSVPSDVIAKHDRGGPLTDAERYMVARIPTVSRGLIFNIPRLEKVAEYVYCADRAFNGKGGFPNDKPVGEAIPAPSRLLNILFSLARATEQRESLESAFEMLEESHGTYDPRLLLLVHDTILAAEKDEDTIDLPISLLLPGHRLKSDLVTRQGWLVLSSGNVLSQIQVERLRNLAKMFPFQEPVRVIRRARHDQH